VVTGRGLAYAQRNGTVVAIVAEVDIDRPTGKVWAREFTVAHDCGQIINPDGLVKCIEGNIMQGVSRALWEEVISGTSSVTSVDWISYPILDFPILPRCFRVRSPVRFASFTHPACQAIKLRTALLLYR